MFALITKLLSNQTVPKRIKINCRPNQKDYKKNYRKSVSQAEENDLLNRSRKPKQRNQNQQNFSDARRQQLRSMKKRDVRENQKHKGQTQIKNLHYIAVDKTQRFQIVFPIKQTPKQEMKDSKANMINSADVN
jgi:hypothetical protein